MELGQMIAGIEGVRVTGDTRLRIAAVACDSRKVAADTLFFAYDDDPRLKELLARFPQHSVYAYKYPSQLDPFP